MTTKVYVEGGGDRNKALRTECRRAFRAFFEKAGLKQRLPQVVACGSRQRAYEDFRRACTSGVNEPVLLVDSEGPVDQAGAWTYLRNKEGWRRPRNAQHNSAHLMVQCMESWFWADKQALANHYGPGLNRKLLTGGDIEKIPKADVERHLHAATRQSQRGSYRKSRDSFAILGKIDAQSVCRASPHARRLVEKLTANATLERVRGH